MMLDLAAVVLTTLVASAGAHPGKFDPKDLFVDMGVFSKINVNRMASNTSFYF